MTTIDTVVLESIHETADTRTLVLDAGSTGMQSRAGQYVTVDPHQFVGLQSFIGYLEAQKGRSEPPRAYSMSSAPHEPLAITIKEEVFERGQTKYPPLISGFLVHQLRAGDRIIVKGFAGNFVLPENVEQQTEHVLHLVAGSGSVPNFAMVKDSLHRHERLRHTFIYSNKSWDDIIFRDALEELQDQYPSRLRVIHTLTRGTAPPSHPGVLRGRVDTELLRDVLGREPQSLVYTCGPAVSVWERRACAAAGTTPSPKFLESMLSHLDALGFPRKQVRVEAYG